eukprot:10027462-Alexandrium_andersonii.AAC.1
MRALLPVPVPALHVLLPVPCLCPGRCLRRCLGLAWGWACAAPRLCLCLCPCQRLEPARVSKRLSS